jgi:hypothetical protein
MSMIANLLRVSSEELEAYLNDSSLLENRIYDDEGEDQNLIDIDKAWDGILFLLTGESIATLEAREGNTASLARIFFSEQFIDEDQDLGYGPGQYLTPEQVKELNTQISAISIEDLKKNYDPKRMIELEVYPSIWENEDEVNYLIEYFEVIQDVYSEAVKKNEGIIMFLN